jgi:hypothetical protein
MNRFHILSHDIRTQANVFTLLRHLGKQKHPKLTVFSNNHIRISAGSQQPGGDGPVLQSCSGVKWSFAVGGLYVEQSSGLQQPFNDGACASLRRYVKCRTAVLLSRTHQNGGRVTKQQ